jgi:hypothetical protein
MLESKRLVTGDYDGHMLNFAVYQRFSCEDGDTSNVESITRQDA